MEAASAKNAEASADYPAMATMAMTTMAVVAEAAMATMAATAEGAPRESASFAAVRENVRLRA